MSDTLTRLCDRCMIKWQATSKTRDCPKCGIDSFFTSNANDIGTFIYMEGTGKIFADYEEYKVT